jgi:hypothetical protein
MNLLMSGYLQGGIQLVAVDHLLSDVLDSERAAESSLPTTDIYDSVFTFGDFSPWEVSGYSWIGSRPDCA